jgi:hypothetical protein
VLHHRPVEPLEGLVGFTEEAMRPGNLDLYTRSRDQCDFQSTVTQSHPLALGEKADVRRIQYAMTFSDGGSASGRLKIRVSVVRFRSGPTSTEELGQA